MNQYGLPLKAPVTQTLIPAMNESGLMYGFYIVNTTTFNGTETSLTLIDNVVPLTTVTLDYNAADPLRVTQYMAAVFSKNTPMLSQPWSSSVLVTPGDGLSREWLLAAQGYGARETKGVLLNAISASMNPNLGPAPIMPPPQPDPLVNTPMSWTVNLDRYMAEALPANKTFFDINWMTTFNAQSKVRGVSIAIVSTPSNGFRVGIIGTPIDVPAVQATTGSTQSIIYETLRFIILGIGAGGGDFVYVFRVTCVDGSTTDVTLTVNSQAWA